MVTSFLTDARQLDSASVEVRASTDRKSGREFVKVIVYLEGVGAIAIPFSEDICIRQSFGII